ncbi:unnamed protein product [Lactuca virosa]|uniref:Uncharacterized protein n=1 Tax=Lactuca virosa TaxID=75947 RepID=A0AAU9M2L5_9ASTR|nr:unnamed protein product [Lactuca virosa]
MAVEIVETKVAEVTSDGDIKQKEKKKTSDLGPHCRQPQEGQSTACNSGTTSAANGGQGWQQQRRLRLAVHTGDNVVG